MDCDKIVFQTRPESEGAPLWRTTGKGKEMRILRVHQRLYNVMFSDCALRFLLLRKVAHHFSCLGKKG